MQRVKDCYGCDYLKIARQVSSYKPANYHRVGIVHYYHWCEKYMKRCSRCSKCKDLTINSEKVEGV